MAINNNQLDTWSHQGSITMSSQTYSSIKNCIDSINWNNDISYEIYLQGSYKNSTNIFGESDVDIVVEFTSIFSSNTSNLDLVGKEVYNNLPDAKYTLDSFKSAIVEKLKSNYGEQNVIVGPKAIQINGNGSRLKADVVICNTYKYYLPNNNQTNLPCIKGILFVNTENYEKIINYPKKHYDNGVAKNTTERTNGNYKKIVRIFRNIKAYLVNNKIIESKQAPSYFIECLLFNIDDNNYKSSSNRECVINVLNQIITDFKNGNVDNYNCQNKMIKLFGISNQQWNKDDAILFLRETIKLWNQN